MLGFRLVRSNIARSSVDPQLVSSTQAELRLGAPRVSKKGCAPMSGKKARKTRPSKQLAPATAARGARSKQVEGKAALEKRTPPKRALSPLEIQLRRALAEMGLARARRVFAAVEASFDD